MTGDALHRRASLPDRLLLNSNHAHRYRSPLSLRHFQPRLHRQCFSFEWFGQRRELTIDVFEEQPLLDDFGHLRFIAQALLLVIMLATVNHGSRFEPVCAAQLAQASLRGRQQGCRFIEIGVLYGCKVPLGKRLYHQSSRCSQLVPSAPRNIT